MRAIPSKALGLHLRAGEFSFGAKYRPGLPVFTEEGDHAISWGYGGERIARHSHLRDVVFQTAQQAQLGPRKEASSPARTSAGGRPHTNLDSWQGHSDQRNRHAPATVWHGGEGGGERGFAVETAHNRKVVRYANCCEEEGVVFAPLAVDTLGGWHDSALVVIDKLGRHLARAVGRVEAALMLHLRQRLGVVFLRDNVSLLGSRAPVKASAQVTGLL